MSINVPKGLLSFVFFLQCHASGMPACPYTHAPPRCPDGECSWSDSQAMDCEASTHQTSQEECTAKKLNYSLSESREQTWCTSLWSGWYTHSQWYDGSQQFLHCTTQPPAGPPFRYLHSIPTGHELVWRLSLVQLLQMIMRGWAFWISLQWSVTNSQGWLLYGVKTSSCRYRWTGSLYSAFASHGGDHN